MGERSLTVRRFEEIRRRLSEGRGLREIARALSCSRDTVREVRDGLRVSPDAAKTLHDPLWMLQVDWPPDSRGARLVGVDGLRPEKSTNFSTGFVLHPASALVATLDFYQISIRNRITPSGSVYGTGVGGSCDAVEQAIIANGNVLPPGAVTGTGIQIFANGLDTRTRGSELVLSYPMPLADGSRITGRSPATTMRPPSPASRRARRS